MGVVKFTRETARDGNIRANKVAPETSSAPQITEAELLARLRAVLKRKQAKKRVRPPSPVAVIARSAKSRSPFMSVGTTQVSPFDMIAEWLGALQVQDGRRMAETVISIRTAPQPNTPSPPGPRPEVAQSGPPDLPPPEERPARPVTSHTLPSEPPGDPAFWGAWIEHHDQMKRLALGLMRGNQADAEDALGTAMLRAHKAYDSAQIRNAAAWFNRLVRNSCIDLYRLRARAPSYAELPDETADVGAAVATHTTRSKSSEDELLSNEGLYEVMGHIFELPEDLMEPLLLRCLAERSYDEISQAMGLSNAAVRKRVQLARRHLVETMAKGD